MLQSPIVIPNIHHLDIVLFETLPSSFFREILIHLLHIVLHAPFHVQGIAIIFYQVYSTQD